MAFSMLEYVVRALFGGDGAASDGDVQLIGSATEMVVDTVEPRVRLHPRYREKLKGSVRATIAHLRGLARERFDPLLLSPSAWSDDPRINAFFGAAADVPVCLGRSRELRTFFADPSNAGAGEAYALLGMQKEERSVFAPRFEDGLLKQDVAQIAVTFSGHRLVAPSASPEALRLEVGRRLIRRLAQVALARIVALDQKAVDLNQQKEFLAARLRLLNLARDGMEGIVADPSTIDERITAAELEFQETFEKYVEAKASLATLDGYIRQITDVFSQPDQHLMVTHTPLRLTRMNLKVGDTSEPANELVLAELTIGDKLRAAVAPVRCPRSELPPEADLIAAAQRSL